MIVNKQCHFLRYLPASDWVIKFRNENGKDMMFSIIFLKQIDVTGFKINYITNYTILLNQV